MDKLYVVKIGGNIIDSESALETFLREFAQFDGRLVLVHGGGKLATRLGEALNIPQQLIDGRRITDAETLKVVTMVYAGYVNKNIVAKLQARSRNAIGICGADGDLVRAKKRSHPSIDYGFVGDVLGVNAALLKKLLQDKMVPVIAPVSHDGTGQLLNTNADTIAQEIARSLANDFEVTLVYGFENAGVMRDVNDADSVIPRLDSSTYRLLKDDGVIYAGMIPKLDNAFAALDAGIKKVIIGKASDLRQLIEGNKGTTISNG